MKNKKQKPAVVSFDEWLAREGMSSREFMNALNEKLKPRDRMTRHDSVNRWRAKTATPTCKFRGPVQEITRGEVCWY